MQCLRQAAHDTCTRCTAYIPAACISADGICAGCPLRWYDGAWLFLSNCRIDSLFGMERPNTAKGTLRRERRTDWCDCMDGSECNSCDPGVCNSFVGFLFLLLNMGCFTMKTKKFISLLVMLGITVAMLTACGGSKLDGTYRSQGLISQSFTFDGDQVTMSALVSMPAAHIGSRVIKSSSHIPCLARNTPGSSPFHSREM